MKGANSSQRGVALVIVLAFLVLITALVMGFFSSVTNELKYAKTASNTSIANQLNDSAVNLVMSQIVEATKGGSSSGQKVAWASQPGMIRTYAANGQAAKSFKLYSSDQMVVDDVNPESDVPQDWSAKTNAGLFVDMNSPVLSEDPDGPIQPDPAKPERYSAIYPILDPFAENIVEGFKLTKRPGFSGGDQLPDATYDPTQQSPVGKTSNPAPMPVRWLYVLKDGSIGPAAAGGNAVTVTGASKENPIVGRIAFWTDDETAKININTASEGVYWDIPRAYSEEDVGVSSGAIAPGQKASKPGLALCQPANKEYQRYPGHPATTCLSTVFAKMGLLSPLSPPTKPPTNYTVMDANGPKNLGEYYKLAPRVPNPDASGKVGSTAGTIIPSTALTPDSDRLYSSIDELMFMPTVTGGGKRIANTSTDDKPNLITKESLEKARFFITANSSAPEVTLFNTPRVGIWPVWDQTAGKALTAFDKLAAFCSTVNGKAYYFTRKNPRSSTDDYDRIPRNQELYKYLQAETSAPIPGFGDTFAGKYPGGDRDQILTSIFDYIRCINLSDTSTGAAPFVQAPTFIKHPTETEGGGEVIPIRIGSTQGFGRFDTVTEFALVFYKEGDTTMRAAVLLGFGTPMQGNIGYQALLKYRITGLNNLKVKPAGTSAFVSLNMFDATNYIESSDLQTNDGRGLGGIEGPAMAFVNGRWLDAWKKTKKEPYKVADNPKASSRGHYPFFSQTPVSVTATQTTFDLQQTPIKIEILTGDPNLPETVVQTLNMTIPSTTGIRMPIKDSASKFEDRVKAAQDNNIYALVRGNDTVIALQIGGTGDNSSAQNTPDNTAGDMRMTAALPNVPANRFRPHKDWTATASTGGKAYGLISSLGKTLPGAATGLLVSGASYGTFRQPGVPSRVSSNGVKRKDGGPGDWDTGTGVQKDGAYINKADEGDQQFVDQVANTPNRIPYFQKDDHMASAGTVFSPNRQIPSPLMFGSIPTGVQRFLPWQTLLFHPRPEDTGHPGRISPKDHLLADLFWMPVVEPYAISQPFSTNGKINLNYQIQPFTYIERSTGVRAVMKSTRFMALKALDALKYKPFIAGGQVSTLGYIPSRRYSIDMDATLKDFQAKFDNKELFLSATQICDMNLYPLNGDPQASNNAAMKVFWQNNTLTGDNLREKPYVDIYPRLTTKSNTFTVHVCVQSLKKTPKTSPTEFVDPDSDGAGPKDLVLSEYRGSSIIERYIDPNDPDLPDFATMFAANPSDAALNIDQYYKFRIVGVKRFAP